MTQTAYQPESTQASANESPCPTVNLHPHDARTGRPLDPVARTVAEMVTDRTRSALYGYAREHGSTDGELMHQCKAIWNCYPDELTELHARLLFRAIRNGQVKLRTTDEIEESRAMRRFATASPSSALAASDLRAALRDVETLLCRAREHSGAMNAALVDQALERASTALAGEVL
jgi:hypothetical protein